MGRSERSRGSRWYADLGRGAGHVESNDGVDVSESEGCASGIWKGDCRDCDEAAAVLSFWQSLKGRRRGFEIEGSVLSLDKGVKIRSRGKILKLFMTDLTTFFFYI